MKTGWLWLCALVACDDGGGGAAPTGLRIEGEGIAEVAQLRLVIKRTVDSDAGGSGRVVSESLLAVNAAELAAGVRVPSSALPPGDDPAFVHAVALLDGVVVGVGDGRADSPVIVRPYEARCDQDGDTYLDCDNGACCASLSSGLFAEFSDCHDNPAIPTPEPPDAKQRVAADAHPFTPRERGDDYLTCENGLDDDCLGGDRICDDTDADADGVSLGEDCDDSDPTRGTGLPELGGNDTDDDCDGQVDEATDLDGDGYAGDDPDPTRADCDDNNPRVHPFRGEVPCNQVDDDCTGGDRCVMGDVDGDGVLAPQDCDDYDAATYPGAPEKCGDGRDQDCAGGDLACAAGDTDQDGFVSDDCAEGDATRFPGAPERCDDGVDQDCDGNDVACGGRDDDQDGFLAPADCNEGDPQIGPAAAELCDRVDNDCDGRVDEGNPLQRPGLPELPPTCGTDTGICQVGPHVCSRTEGAAGAEILCLETPPGEETCDGLDNDCDGTIDRPAPGLDQMPDEGLQPCGPEREIGACRQGTLFCAQGSLSECRGAVEGLDETCNGNDDDCDGRVDEGEGGGALAEPCFDGDAEQAAQGTCREGQRRCRDGAFTACEGQLLPADEACNGFDDDCDGSLDEGLSIACYTFDPATEGVGACRPGERRCNGADFGECEGQVGPSVETCNDEDDDCDGRIDQYTEACFGEPGQGLDGRLIGIGVCEAGFRSCRDGRFGECAGDVLPAAESCDRIDNDCDGRSDETFDLINDPQNCRECGRRCNAGEGCCASACRPLNTPENCGACGRTCGDDSDRCAVGAGGAECRCGAGPACEDGLRCINGSCRCVENTDCGNNELCCNGACQPTGVATQCEACGVACPAGQANSCTDRECTCGEGGECPDATVCSQVNGQGEFLCRGCGRNSQCPADAICCGGVCTPTSAAANCTACGRGCDSDVADFCRGAEASDVRACVCGENGQACPDPLVCVFGREAGDGRCAECRDDVDCGANFPGRPRCVDNICRACNPRDHRPCGQGQLCCGFECVATGAGVNSSCEQCGVACAQEQTNACNGRSCGCGNNPPCAPGSAAPLCDDARGVCVQCRGDVDCAGHPGGGQCVNNLCVSCDPADQAGCVGSQLCCIANGTPTCEEASIRAGQCQACDRACDAPSTNTCQQRNCQCGNNPPCGGATPICDDAAGECVECTVDANCNGHPRGSQCVNRMCQPCDPNDQAGCGANQLCCNAGNGPVCQATGPGAADQCEGCGVACSPTASVDRCTARDCACGAGGACGGATPYCVGAACVACRNHGDCPVDQLCCGGVCEATGGGAAQQCEACDLACNQVASNRCGSRRCACGADPACAGDTPICREDAQGRALGCVQCLADVDCGGFPGRSQCVGFVCVACDPADAAGCDEAGAAPICSNNACRACGNDGECSARPGARNECVAGRCQRCDPGDDAGCPAEAPICDPQNLTCRACGNDVECGGNQQCVAGRCRGCDPATDEPCTGVTPICEPSNFSCRACSADGDCLDRPGADDQCVDGLCRRCDPTGNTGCNANELCCGFQCTAVTVDSCPACNVGCDDNTADSCVGRACQCGDAPACGGQTPFCDDGDCVGCRGDADCGGARPECVGTTCERCDPMGNAGCVATSNTPICDPVDLTCEACTDDAQCVGNPRGPECQADGSCGPCDPRNNAGCGGRTPICAAGNPPVCQACARDNQCPAGQQCVMAGPLAGACSQCDPADGAGCGLTSTTPVCDQATARCRACGGNGECGDPQNPICTSAGVLAGACRPCDPADHEGCNPASNTPICSDPNNPRCVACANDPQCVQVAAAPGDECIVGGAVGGSCQVCDPVGHSGCNVAGAAPACDGNTYSCRVCQNDGECRGALPFCSGGRCRACLDDSHCGGQVCVNNVCQNCAGAADCDGHPLGRVCGASVAGQCGCDAAGDCYGTACVADRCTLCQNDNACVGNVFGTQCGAGIAGVCGCDVSADCGERVCQNALCRGCVGNGECVGHPAGPLCGIAQPGDCGCAQNAECGALVCTAGACAACVDDAACVGHPRGSDCGAAAPGQCGCDTVADCGLEVCQAGACEACVDDADCAGHPAGDDCGAVQAGACGCLNAADCPMGMVCTEGRCQ